MRVEYSYIVYGTKEFNQPVSEIIIGRHHRGRQIDLDLTPDGKVSRLHARLVYDNDTYWIEDLGSRHGTWINGEQVTEKIQITPDDIVRMGDSVLKVLPVQEPDEEAKPHEPPIVSTRRDFTVPPEITPDESVIENGAISFMLDATQDPFSPSDKDRTHDLIPQMKRQMRALYDITQVLGKICTREEFLPLLVDELRRALPSAQRGIVMLVDEYDRLHPRIHWPDDPPEPRDSLIEQACVRRSTFMWSILQQRQTATEVPDDAPKSAIYAPLLWQGHLLGLIYVENRNSSVAFSSTDCDLLRAISHQVTLSLRNQVRQQEMQRETAIRSSLLRQFAPDTTEKLLEHRDQLRLGGSRTAPVTILSLIVRGFHTSIAMMRPDEIIHLVDRIYAAFVPIIFKHDGVLFQYNGYALTALFGTPESDDDQWEKAVLVALAIQHEMRAIVGQWHSIGLAQCGVSIGIHTGEIVQGFIGPLDRVQYMAVGDAFAWAERYCHYAKQDEIIISKEVQEHVFRLVEVESKIIPGLCDTDADTDSDADADAGEDGACEVYSVKRLKG